MRTNLGKTRENLIYIKKTQQAKIVDDDDLINR